jgi:hypothetical protein
MHVRFLQSADHWPEEHNMSTTYLPILVCHYLKQAKEALAILGKTVLHMREDYPIINESRYDVCITSYYWLQPKESQKMHSSGH